jgi:hypothetical protein
MMALNIQALVSWPRFLPLWGSAMSGELDRYIYKAMISSWIVIDNPISCLKLLEMIFQH